MSRLLIDPGHPHTFTPLRIHRRLRKHGFRVEAMEVGSLKEAWFDDLRGPSVKKRVKALLGASEYVVCLVASAAPADARAGVE